MSKTKKAAKRASNLQARFSRIKAAIQVTDTLVDTYFERRGDEIEAFNAELQAFTEAREAEPQVN